MARKKSTTLTDGELKIMEVLWQKGEASVKDIAETLAKKQTIAYNTVLTMTKILAEKGYASYRKEGRAFIYHPILGKKEASNSALRHLLSRFFNNSPALLVQNLIENETVAPAELAHLKKQIADSAEEV